MVKFLAFGDIVENKEALEKFSRLNFSPYDFVVFCGDILSMEVFKRMRKEKVTKGKIAKTEGERKRELKEEIERKELLEKEAEKLKGLNKSFQAIKNKISLYGVWGNADHAWLISRAQVGGNIINLHLNPLKIKDFWLVGYEGRPKYIFETYENPTEHAFDENQAFKELSDVLKKLDGRVILITHAPPYEMLDQVEEKYRKYAVGTYGERAKEGNIGSITFRKITKKFKPILHIFGHIHECKGVRKTDKTTFINTGSFGGEREFVEIEILDHKPQVKFIRL